MVDAPRMLRGVRQVEDWALGRDHTNGGRRPCHKVCVGSGWTFTRTRARWRCSTTSRGGDHAPRDRPGDRIKTDKRDAIRLARLLAAGDLKLVWIPSPEQEQLRDLVRCREDLRSDLMRARHRLATFLLRRERYFPGPGGRWTLKHRHWLSQQHFHDHASRITYADYLHGHDVLLARRELVARELEQIAPDCVWSETIARLCCLRSDRHPDRARAVRRDRRLAALRASRLAGLLCRPGPDRAQL